MNNALKMALDQGATMKMIAEDWEFLQIQVRTPPHTFFDSFLTFILPSFLLHASLLPHLHHQLNSSITL